MIPSVLTACSPAIPTALDPRVPPESGGPYDRAAYIADLVSAGLADTRTAGSWRDAHEQALRTTLEGGTKPLPSELRRHFHPRRPGAYAVRFAGVAEVLTVAYKESVGAGRAAGGQATAGDTSMPFFLELYRVEEGEAVLLAATHSEGFVLELEGGADYVLVVQAAVGAAGPLILRPSLGE